MGFVHHSNYLRYFEIARLEWLRQLGISYKEMELNKVFLPVASASIHYKKPCFFEDLLTVYITLKEAPKASLDFHYSMLNQDNVCICTGETRLAFFNAVAKLPMRCPEELLKCFQNVLAADQS